MRPDSSGARRAERAAAAAAGLTVEPEVGRSRGRAATDSHLKSGRMSVRSISVTSHCPVFGFFNFLFPAGREADSGNSGKCECSQFSMHVTPQSESIKAEI